MGGVITIRQPTLLGSCCVATTGMVGLHFLGFLGMVCVCPVPLDVLKRLAAAAQDFDFFDLRLVSTKLMVMGRPMMGRPPGCLMLCTLLIPMWCNLQVLSYLTFFKHIYELLVWLGLQFDWQNIGNAWSQVKLMQVCVPYQYSFQFSRARLEPNRAASRFSGGGRP